MSGTVSSSRSLHCLVYSSKQSTFPEDLPAVEIDRIVAKSITNNSRDTLTGLLLVHQGWFVQALEGPAERVISTYQRILDDKRHQQGKVLSSGPVIGRNFGEWDMCARRISKLNDEILDTLAQRGQFLPPALKGGQALRLLRSVSEIQARIEKAS